MSNNEENFIDGLMFEIQVDEHIMYLKIKNIEEEIRIIND